MQKHGGRRARPSASPTSAHRTAGLAASPSSSRCALLQKTHVHRTRPAPARLPAPVFSSLRQGPQVRSSTAAALGRKVPWMRKKKRKARADADGPCARSSSSSSVVTGSRLFRAPESGGKKMMARRWFDVSELDRSMGRHSPAHPSRESREGGRTAACPN